MFKPRSAHNLDGRIPRVDVQAQRRRRHRPRRSQAQSHVSARTQGQPRSTISGKFRFDAAPSSSWLVRWCLSWCRRYLAHRNRRPAAFV